MKFNYIIPLSILFIVSNSYGMEKTGKPDIQEVLNDIEKDLGDITKMVEEKELSEEKKLALGFTFLSIMLSSLKK